MQLHGSAQSPKKCPASSLLSLMISPEFIVQESYNELMKFRDNLRELRHGIQLMPGTTLPKPMWDMGLDEAASKHREHDWPHAKDISTVLTKHHLSAEIASFWSEMIRQEPLISGCNRALEKTQAYLWGYIMCRWWWLKCGICLDVRHCILASSKDCPTTVVRVSEAMCSFSRGHSGDCRI